MNPTHITSVPIAPLRGESRDSAEMVSQALFGDLLTILEEKPSWIRVRLQADGYEGWMDPKQVLPLSSDWLAKHRKFGYVQVDCIRLKRNDGSGSLRLTRGCAIPLDEHDQPLTGIFGIELDPSHWRLPRPFQPGVLRAEALDYLGAPYLWGGKTPWGIDCSGFSQMVYRICGLSLPRDSSVQAGLGEEVEWGRHREGDLAFFSRTGEKITHVGVISGNDTVIHASGRVREDRIEDGIILNPTDTATFPHKLVCIKRYTPND